MKNIGKSNEDNLVPAKEGSKGEEIEPTTNYDELQLQPLSNIDNNVSTGKRLNNNETRGKTPEGSSKDNNSPSESDGKDQNANIERSATNREVSPAPVQSSNIDNNVSPGKRSNNNETRGKTTEGSSKDNNSPSESDGKDQNANIETPATNREVPSPPVQPHLDAEETENRELPPPDNRNIFIRAREAEQNYHPAFFLINSFLTAYHTGVGTASAAYPFKEWDKTSDRDRVLGTMSFIGVVLLTILPYIWYCTFFWREKIAKKRENREREPDA
ncbi:hypothetical protein BVG19_g5708 [[Candida] boidinii]|nr:hypothetical protein BVG19_g5708 [[Candida] boidinii]